MFNNIFLGEEGRVAPYTYIELPEEVLIRFCCPNLLLGALAKYIIELCAFLSFYRGRFW